MTNKEKAFAAILLEMANDHYSNHGCNDFDHELIAPLGLTDEEKIALAREFHQRNRDLAEVEPVGLRDFYAIPDYCWLWLMAQKLKEEASS